MKEYDEEGQKSSYVGGGGIIFSWLVLACWDPIFGSSEALQGSFKGPVVSLAGFQSLESMIRCPQSYIESRPLGLWKKQKNPARLPSIILTVEQSGNSDG
jgi:hypothetical protein